MSEFFKMIINLIGWIILAIGFVLYLRYQELFANAPKIIAYLGSVALIGIGMALILFRSYCVLKKVKGDKESIEEEDKVIKITPIDELKHDIIGLITAVLIIFLVFFKGDSLNGVDIMQAGIGFLGVMALRFIYRP